MTGGGRILHTNGSHASIYIAFDAFAAVEVFLILICNVLARRANLVYAQNRLYVRPFIIQITQ